MPAEPRLSSAVCSGCCSEGDNEVVNVHGRAVRLARGLGEAGEMVP